jgi:tetratricopeptide (TPR) repeat protein
MEETLDRLLDDCTVCIQSPNIFGTGFFVAPGLILTCDHVIEQTRSDPAQIIIHYKGENYPTQEIVQFFEKPYLDVALLRIQKFSHPCVFLDGAIEPFARLYSFGYTDEHPRGESVTLECEGRTFFEKPNQPFLKLKGGQVQHGASGSPLLNWQTGKVCGVIKFTRDADTDIGGGAIPIDAILAKLPSLRKENATFHQADTRWAKALKRQLSVAFPVSAVNAILYKQAGKIHRPRQLFGREELLAEANFLLDKVNRVLLCGFTGLGKTALAATIVDKRIQDGKLPAIWLNAGYASSITLFETLAECLEAKQAISNNADEAQVIIRDLLNEKNIQLVVVDDARDGAVLDQFIKAIPNDIPVLVTSQHRFPLEKILEVNELPLTDALKALGYYAGQDAILHDHDAKLLCEQLGFHTYALEIAGDIMKVDCIKPNELRRKMNPYELKKPEGLALPGREGLRELLEYSLKTLDQASRETFMAFGAFFTSGATLELVSAYLDEEPSQVEKNLSKLTRRSLTKRRPETDYYYLPDIAFSYVRAKFKEEQHDAQRMIQAVHDYLSRHAQDYERLELDMPNILETAGLAENLDLVRIMSILTTGGYPRPEGRSYLDERGHTLEMLERLGQAIEAAKLSGSELHTTLHYLAGKQGNALYDRGDLMNSLTAFQIALELAPSINRQAKLLCAVTKVLIEQGDESGYHHLDRAYQIAKDYQDDDALGFVLQYRTHFAIQRKDHVAAHRFAVETVEIHRRLGDPIILGFSLLNLGTAEFDLGNLNEAKSKHEEALEIARKEGYVQLISDILHALAEDYHTLGQREQAQKYFDDALAFCRQSGDTGHEAQIVLLMGQTGYTESKPSVERSTIQPDQKEEGEAK